MFPRTDREEGLHVRVGRQPALAAHVSRQATAGCAVSEDGVDELGFLVDLERAHGRHDVGCHVVHVDGLAAEMRVGVGRAGDVGGHDGDLVFWFFDQPDEARAEHGVGGGDECGAERFDG